MEDTSLSLGTIFIIGVLAILIIGGIYVVIQEKKKPESPSADRESHFPFNPKTGRD